jgi:hypothetical protein
LINNERRFDFRSILIRSSIYCYILNVFLDVGARIAKIDDAYLDVWTFDGVFR